MSTNVPQNLVDFSNATIDTRTVLGPQNRITNTFTELGDNIGIIESFSHIWVVRTADGLVLFDVSRQHSAGESIASLRKWSTEPVHTIVYTHGHADHVGGAAAWIADAQERGHRRPIFVGHENVAPRLARYRLTNDYNLAINHRQFSPSKISSLSAGERFIDDFVPDPDVTFQTQHTLVVGDDTFELAHDLGETNDHAWTKWVGHDTIFVGDFLIWNFPNCGNPQKVLRYPIEWAQALRKMIATNSNLVGPAHGLPVFGSHRAELVLGTTAGALEKLVGDVIELINADARIDEAIHNVKVDPEILNLPWMRPFYDEPEFVVHNIWRTYAGWWDRNPAHLLPPKEVDLARAIVAMSGGVDSVVKTALAHLAQGSTRVSAELIEYALLADPLNKHVHETRTSIYASLRSQASSLMAKSIFQAQVLESAEVAGIEPPAMKRAHVLS